MLLFPAIDLVGGKAVRLVRGDYNNMTVYSEHPELTAEGFRTFGAEYLHVVDLEGARDGNTANFETIAEIIRYSRLKTEVGGGVRSRAVIERYLNAGAFRVILGTAALTEPGFVKDMVGVYGDKIAVGVDIKDGFPAVKGWTEVVKQDAFTFCKSMEDMGVATIICTDISKDGLLGGTNLELYEKLSKELSVNIVASGGVSSLADIRALHGIGIYGAILGKALYTHDIDLAEAIKMIEAIPPAAGWRKTPDSWARYSKDGKNA